MSRFYASIEGTSGVATKGGDKNSGMSSHTRGWDIGCRVYCSVGEDGKDRVTVSITKGSNGGGRFRDLGTYRVTKTGRIVKDNG